MFSTSKLLRRHSPFSFWAQWIALCTLLLIAGALGLFVTETAWSESYRLLSGALLASLCLFYPRLGVFTRYRPPAASLVFVTAVWSVALLAAVGSLLLLAQSLRFAPEFLVVFYLLGWCAHAIVVLATTFLFSSARSRLIEDPVVLVGSGELAHRIHWGLSRNSFLPDKVIGFVDDVEPKPDAATQTVSAPYLGRIEDLKLIVQRYGVKKVFIALPLSRSDQVQKALNLVAESNTDVIWAPDIFALDLLNPGVRELAGVPLLAVCESPLSSLGGAYVKSLIDVVVATTATVVLSPLLLLIAVAVKISSRGPIFYKQKRHGWDGAIFEIWKFRSMRVHDEGANVLTQATQNDRRVTAVGRFLRRTSLDELPQLFNVINGTMSLVGPRPHAVVHNYEYAQKIGSYMSRHRIKPGITGWAQVNGLRGETDSLEKMTRRVGMDIEYINRWSPILDLWILLRTPIALFSKRGAY